MANGPSLPARETAVPSIEPLNSASTCDCAIACPERELVDRRLRLLACRVVAIGERAAADGKVTHEQRSRPRIELRSRRSAGRCPELPVAPAVLVRFERDDGLDQLQPDELEVPPQERQQRDVQFETFRRDEVRRLAPGRVGETHILGDDSGHESDPQSYCRRPP